MLRHVRELRARERQLRALYFRVRDRMLWRQGREVRRALEGISGRVEQARREVDAAVDAEAAARLMTLPRAMGEHQFVK